MKKIRLNLGCGKKYLEGYVNCDYLPQVKADKYFDLNRYPYPFKKDSVDEIFLDNVLEHLNDVFSSMKEFHRILKKDGILRINVPYAKSDRAFQDPTHKHFFTEHTLDYFTSDYYYGYYSTFKYNIKIARLYTDKNSLVQKIRNLLPLKSLLTIFLFNIYDGVYFELEKI